MNPHFANLETSLSARAAALDQLSDQQLADIGLDRGDISRVFEPGFALQAANDGALPAGRAA
jgi:hypothetical protein